MLQVVSWRRANLRALRCGILGFACALPACGDDEGAKPATAPEAREVSGGGVTGDALGARLSVVVVDAISGRRVPGALVQRANTAANARTNHVGVTGLDVGTERPVIVTVSAAGYVPASWQGLQGSMLTVPLVPSGYRAPHALVSGTLDGWEALQPSAPSRYLIAHFAHSRRPDLDSIDTVIERDATEQVTCTKRGGSDPCRFSLRVPVSRRTVFVSVAEVDEQNTENEPSDDTFSVVALGLTGNLSLTAGGSAPGLRMSFQLASALSRVRVDPTRLPDLSRAVVGLPGVNASGEVLLFDAFPRAPEFLVPSRSDLPDAKLWSVATANDAPDGTRLRAFVRGIDVPETGASVQLESGALRAAPAVTRTPGGGLVVDAAGGLVQVRGYRGTELVAEAMLLSAPYEVTLPAAVAPDAITVTAYEAALNPAEMSLQNVRERALSLAERTIAP